MTEFELIQRYFVDDSGDAVVGVGDDAAVIACGADEQLAVAVDTLVAGRHFLDSTAAEAIGHRALAVNLSDLAAMGATPRYMTLALTLPAADPQWLEAFAAGLRQLAAAHGVQLVGGDTTRGPLTISVQVIGALAGAPLLRSGARIGDRVVVSGTLGDAAAGLAIARGSAPATEHERYLLARYERPSPRVALGLRLAGRAHAAIDVSDGLLADLGHICAASNVGARLDANALPLSPALRAQAGDAEALRHALAGGDDYELCFTVAASENLADFEGCTAIGTIVAGAGVTVANLPAGVTLAEDGYRHF